MNENAPSRRAGPQMLTTTTTKGKRDALKVTSLDGNSNAESTRIALSEERMRPLPPALLYPSVPFLLPPLSPLPGSGFRLALGSARLRLSAGWFGSYSEKKTRRAISYACL